MIKLSYLLPQLLFAIMFGLVFFLVLLLVKVGFPSVGQQFDLHLHLSV